MTSLLLPSENSRTNVPDQGWFMGYEVRESGIPGAGNGRFVTEAVAVRERIGVKPLLPMADVTALGDVPYDNTLTFACADDLEKFISLAREEGGYTREQVLHQFENFVWGLDETRCCLNNSTWTMNHGDDYADGYPETVVFVFENVDGREAVVGYAAKDLEAGDELYNNYRDFVIPLWYRDWTVANGIVDVRTLVLSIVDDGGHSGDPARLPEGKVGFGGETVSCSSCSVQ